MHIVSENLVLAAYLQVLRLHVCVFSLLVMNILETPDPVYPNKESRGHPQIMFVSYDQTYHSNSRNIIKQVEKTICWINSHEQHLMFMIGECYETSHPFNKFYARLC